MASNSQALTEKPGIERLKERETFIREYSSGFYEKTWEIEFSPDPDFKKGALFGRLDVLGGISSKALAEGVAWAEGTVFRKKNNRSDKGGILLTVVYPKEQKIVNGKMIDVIPYNRNAILVDYEGKRSYQYTTRTKMIPEALKND